MPIVRCWDPDDLWLGIPEEFEGAEVPAALIPLLKQRPLPRSFALVGPPGTGKTRALWGMLHAIRKNKMAQMMGHKIERMRYREGEYTEKIETVEAAIARVLRSLDGLTIITEVGDIRAKRYDREALDGWASCPGWLAVDDIGAIEPNEWVREAIYHMANERRANGLVTVWTSNKTPQQLRETFGGAIASRILGGAVVEVEGQDRRVS
jgi:DNA replication protein DnaC